MNYLLITLPLTLLGAIIYLLASAWAETYLLKTKRKPTELFINWMLGFWAIMASIGTGILFIHSSANGSSNGALLLVGIACMVLGDRFIYYPNNPPAPVTLEKTRDDNLNGC